MVYHGLMSLSHSSAQNLLYNMDKNRMCTNGKKLSAFTVMSVSLFNGKFFIEHLSAQTLKIHAWSLI